MTIRVDPKLTANCFFKMEFEWDLCVTVPGFMKTPLKIKLVDWYDPKKPKPVTTVNTCNDPDFLSYFQLK